MANEAPHLVVVSNKENFQRPRFGVEQQAELQACPAFKYILSQPPDGDSGMEMRLAETIGQDSQSLFHAGHIRVAQIFKRGEETRTEQDGGFSHASAFR